MRIAVKLRYLAKQLVAVKTATEKIIVLLYGVPPRELLSIN